MVDQSFNIKQGFVCIYYKISVSLKTKIIHYWQDYIGFEVNLLVIQ